MSRFNKILTEIILVFAIATPVIPAAAKDWSDRVQNNFTVDGKHWGFGGRFYFNYGTSQMILRYKFDDSWASQYRYVMKSDPGANEHWFRLQHKDIRFKEFFWNSRIEYRIKESTDDVFRFRPQTGFKFNVLEKAKVYYVIEPHWEYNFGKSRGRFKFTQHFLGFDGKLNKNVTLGSFIEIDTNDNWEMELAFLGTRVEVTIDKFSRLYGGKNGQSN